MDKYFRIMYKMLHIYQRYHISYRRYKKSINKYKKSLEEAFNYAKLLNVKF